jgi:amidophosphoribosyltransferase
MGGFFAVASKEDCVSDLFYGTDYHSHLGTCRGGMAVLGEREFHRHIHDISNAQFRSKFEDDVTTMEGYTGIGVISDNESQPLIIGSHLGNYAIVTVGVITNLEALARDAYHRRITHFSEMSSIGINPTELVATLINEGSTFAEGIAIAQERIEGSCSILLLTKEGIYVARDFLGRTPIIIGKKPGSLCGHL